MVGLEPAASQLGASTYPLRHHYNVSRIRNSPKVEKAIRYKNNLRSGNKEEASSQEEALNGGLRVGELDSIQVQHTLSIG